MFQTLKQLFSAPARRRPGIRGRVLRVEALETRAMLTAGFDWAATAYLNGATKGWETGAAVVTDGAGNSYVTGKFVGAADFDTTDSDSATNPQLALLSNVAPNPSSPTGFSHVQGAYVAKYSPNGQCLWAIDLGENLPDAVGSDGAAIAFDASSGGRVVVTGTRTTLALSSQDGFVAWLDADTGAVESSQIFGGALSNDYGAAIAVDPAGNAYVTGAIENAPASIFVNRDVYIAKFNTDSTKAWEQVVGGSSYADAGATVAVDGVGNVIVGGFFHGTVDFDPGRGTYALSTGAPKTLVVHAGFVLKLTNAGNFAWADAFQLTNSSRSDVKDVVVDAAGNITVLGSYDGTVDLDPNKTSRKVTGAGTFLLQLNAAGKLGWSTTTNNSYAAMALGGDGFVYLTGADSMGAGLVSKLDNKVGSLIQSISLPRSVAGIAVDGSGNLLLTGGFTGTDVDFDFTAGTWLLSAENDQSGMFVTKIHL